MIDMNDVTFKLMVNAIERFACTVVHWDTDCICVCVLKSWFDHYLQWNQSEHPGVKNLRFTTDQVWTPDILLYNR